MNRPFSSRLAYNDPQPVMPDDLDQVASASSENEEIASMRVAMQRLLNATIDTPLAIERWGPEPER